MVIVTAWLRRLLDGLDEGRRPTAAAPPVAATPAPGPPTAIDLRSVHELTFRLLDDARSWRERLVHEIVLGDSDHVRASSAYQVRLPLELVHEFAPEARAGEMVQLLLPLTIRPKELMLDVSLTGPNGVPCSLLLREEGAPWPARPGRSPPPGS